MNMNMMNIAIELFGSSVELLYSPANRKHVWGRRFADGTEQVLLGMADSCTAECVQWSPEGDTTIFYRTVV